jgi:hypothetical protein
MGSITAPSPCLLLLAASSRYAPALQWAGEQLQNHFGRLALASDSFDFTETDYYTPTMGAGLKKQFFACERLIDPAALAAIKRQTNDWEAEYAARAHQPEPRPLNLDPGYITPAKLVLASTKDHAHRIYLQQGIYAEVTLSFRAGRWQPHEWTYPDFRRDDYQTFFSACRARLLEKT